MTSFAVGVAGLLLFVVVAPLLCVLLRVSRPKMSPVMVLIGATLLAHVATIVAGLLWARPFQYWQAASIFGFGVMLYVFAFGAAYKSVSLQILLALRRQRKDMTVSSIVHEQVLPIFRKRIEVLVDSGMVRREGFAFLPTETGRALSTKIGELRGLFAIGDSGLYDFRKRSPAER
jgi:hypothetical protein